MDKNTHYVYKITHEPTGHYYVGRHSAKNMNDGYLGSGADWIRNFLSVYPRREFSKEILWQGGSSLIKQKEMDFIHEHRGPLMVNMMMDSIGGVLRHSKSTCQSISEKKLQFIKDNPDRHRINMMKSAEASRRPETRKRMRDAKLERFSEQKNRDYASEVKFKFIEENPDIWADQQMKLAKSKGTPEYKALKRQQTLDQFKDKPGNNSVAVEVHYVDGSKKTFPSKSKVDGISITVVSDIMDGKHQSCEKKYGIKLISKIKP